MIKINKSTIVPKSLNGKVTQKRRAEIINAGRYPTSKTIKNDINFTSDYLTTYDNRYKANDVKEELVSTYHSKCVYCEQIVEQYQVEHYRTKSVYYWLAYSWDNLLLCCPYCNEYKSNNFPVVSLADINSVPDISDTHNHRNVYDNIEKPQLINPEKEDVASELIFTKTGEISSQNIRVQRTIEICKINREWLNKRRQELYDDFEKKIFDRKFEIQCGNKQAIQKLEGYIQDFISDNQNPKKEYIAFRKYIIKNFLKDLMK